jgi:hypothetical protein
MIAISKERGTNRVVLTTQGDLDDAAVSALLEAIALTDDEAPLVIDLARSGELRGTREIGLLSALSFRAGPVVFRGARPEHDRIVKAVSSAH